MEVMVELAPDDLRVPQYTHVWCRIHSIGL